jgi:hypothetical protein
MIEIKDILIIKEAVGDLDDGRIFYEHKRPGIGNYFWDSLIADLESLIIYAGIHKKKYGLYQMLAKRFPYIIYYDIVAESAYIIAVLPMRKDPAWIRETLKTRS